MTINNNYPDYVKQVYINIYNKVRAKTSGIPRENML